MQNSIPENDRKPLDRRSFFIGILCVTAVLLLLGTLMPIPTAKGEFAVKDRDYQLVTVPVNGGGDSLYVIDNKTGLAAVFIFDSNTRELRPMQIRAVSDAFTQ